MPSDVAVPELVHCRLAPLAAVGSATVLTSAPPGVYSSRKAAVLALVNAAVPSPTRTTTTLPGVNWAGRAAAKASGRKAEVARSEFIGVRILRSSGRGCGQST